LGCSDYDDGFLAVYVTAGKKLIANIVDLEELDNLEGNAPGPELVMMLFAATSNVSSASGWKYYGKSTYKKKEPGFSPGSLL